MAGTLSALRALYASAGGAEWKNSVSACRATTEMLLDDFMDGFLHKLFVQKWDKFGRVIHYARLACTVCYFCLLSATAFQLKVGGAAFVALWRRQWYWPGPHTVHALPLHLVHSLSSSLSPHLGACTVCVLQARTAT